MGVTKETIARNVSYIAELPILGMKGKAYDIVTIVLETMRDALLRGENVRIPGFGTFRVQERKARRTAVGYDWIRLTKRQHREIITIPSKKRVIFTPAKPMLRYINKGNT